MYNVFQKDVLKVVLICISLSTPRGYIGMNEKKSYSHQIMLVSESSWYEEWSVLATNLLPSMIWGTDHNF